MNGSSINLYNSTGATAMATFTTGGSCAFKHGSNTRLETTSTGIQVTPVVTIDGSTPRLQMKPTADSQSHRIEFLNAAVSPDTKLMSGEP